MVADDKPILSAFWTSISTLELLWDILFLFIPSWPLLMRPFAEAEFGQALALVVF